MVYRCRKLSIPCIRILRVAAELMHSKGKPIMKLLYAPLSKATAADVPSVYCMAQKDSPCGCNISV